MKKIKNIFNVATIFFITGKYLLLSQKKKADFTSLKELWCEDLFNHLNIKFHLKGSPISSSMPCLLVGNHISYLDVPVLMSSCPGLAFVGKKEIKNWPIIGNGATKMETIFVERKNSVSRNSAKSEITRALKEKKQKIAIFPSGTTSLLVSPQWKKGVFEIAEEHDILVQPFRLRYTPLRAAAYIDQDDLLSHMYALFKVPQLDVYLEFHEPVKISSHIADCSFWKNWCEDVAFQGWEDGAAEISVKDLAAV